MNSTVASVNQPSFVAISHLTSPLSAGNMNTNAVASNWLSYILIIFVGMIMCVVGIIYWYGLAPSPAPPVPESKYWCYIGKDAGKRMCIELNRAEQCGTVTTYSTADECIRAIA